MKQLLTLFGILLIVSTVTQAQDLVRAEASAACAGEYNGSVLVFINGAYFEDDWGFPFELDVENVTSGESFPTVAGTPLTNIENLSSGYYEITVNLSGTCQIIVDVTVEDGPGAIVTSDVIQPSFEEGCKNGSVNLHIVDGTPPFDVVWHHSIFGSNFQIQSNLGITGQNDGEDISDLGPGNYLAVISDARRCVITREFTLQCACQDIDIDLNVDQLCNGEPGGILITDWDGATGDLIPTWTRNGQPYSEGSFFIFTSDPGEYCVQVIDEAGCTGMECVIMDNFDVQIIVQDVDFVTFCTECGRDDYCSDDGSIDVAIAANDVYDVEWMGPNGYTSNSEDISNLRSGVYIISVLRRSDNSCFVQREINIGVCEEEFGDDERDGCYTQYLYENLDVSLIQLQSADPGICNGAIDVSFWPIGFNAPFVWTGPNGFTSTEEDISGLCAGVYCVSLLSGCDDDQTICYTISECGFSVTADIIAQTSSGQGRILLRPQGGVFDYTYLWNDGSTDFMIWGQSGYYNVTVTDKKGCSQDYTFFIPFCSQQSEIQLDATNVRTCNTSDSRLIVNRLSGSEIVEYRWEAFDVTHEQYNDNLHISPPLSNDLRNTTRFLNITTTSNELPVTRSGLYWVWTRDACGFTNFKVIYIPCSCLIFPAQASYNPLKQIDDCMTDLLTRSKIKFKDGDPIHLKFGIPGSDNAFDFYNVQGTNIKFIWPDGRETDVVPDLSSSAHRSQFENLIEYIVDDPGTYTVTVIDPFGCPHFLDFTFGRIPFSALHIATLGSYLPGFNDPFLEVYDGCIECGTCLGDDNECSPGIERGSDFIPFFYTPNDPLDPCAGGEMAVLDCGGSGDFRTEVPSWSNGYEITLNLDSPPRREGNICFYDVYCFFAQGSIPHPAYDKAIVVRSIRQVICDDETDPPVQECYRLYRELGDCYADVVCLETGEVIEEDVFIPGTLDTCWYERSGICGIEVRCTESNEIIEDSNFPCSEELFIKIRNRVFPCDMAIIGGGDDEYFKGKVNLELPMSVQVYPNPTHGEINVTFENGLSQIAELQIIAMDGRIIKEDSFIMNSNTYDRAYSISKGIYIFKFILESGESIVEKVIYAD